MPARKVATGLPPIMVTCRPKGVFAMTKEKPAKQAIATQALNGMFSTCSMPMTRKGGARSCAERPPDIATTSPRTQI